MPETTKTCQVEMQGKLCGRELYDEECCIFHSKKEDKDVKLFQEKLDEILKDESLGTYDFTFFVFPKEVVFPRRFSKSVSFVGATFTGKVFFLGCIFAGETLFEGAVFEGKVNFAHATFEGETGFIGAVFKSETRFYDTLFKRGVNFWYATFQDSLLINGEEHSKKAFRGEVCFMSVKFSNPEEVEFQKVDLSKFRFRETDLRKVHFSDVDWNKKNNKRRNRVFDEISLAPDWHRPSIRKFDYALIAQLYRRLRANYEENLRYSEAGDFYIGEMEMTREAQTSIFKKLPLLFYKAISNYGEYYYRPLGWIAAILLIFPLLFMFAGIEPMSPDLNNPTGEVISYRLDLTLIESFLPTTEKISDYYTSFLYSMSVFSFIRDKKYTTMNNLGRSLFVLESILSPVTLAFFLLALRRRFKR